NLVGTDYTGNTPGPGNLQGILIDGGSNNTIGGTATGAGNTIKFNSGPGIFVQNRTGPPAATASADQFRENEVVANGSGGALDIDFGSGAPNPATPRLILIAENAQGQASASFSLTGIPGTTYAVEFFKDNAKASPPSRPFLSTIPPTKVKIG